MGSVGILYDFKEFDPSGSKERFQEAHLFGLPIIYFFASLHRFTML